MVRLPSHNRSPSASKPPLHVIELVTVRLPLPRILPPEKFSVEIVGAMLRVTSPEPMVTDQVSPGAGWLLLG